MIRVEIDYIKAQGTGQHRNLYPASRVVELADDVKSTWLVIKEEGGFWEDGQYRVDQEPTFVPKSAVIALRKSDWKGRI